MSAVHIFVKKLSTVTKIFYILFFVIIIKV